MRLKTSCCSSVGRTMSGFSRAGADARSARRALDRVIEAVSARESVELAPDLLGPIAGALRREGWERDDVEGVASDHQGATGGDRDAVAGDVVAVAGSDVDDDSLRRLGEGLAVNGRDLCVADVGLDVPDFVEEAMEDLALQSAWQLGRDLRERLLGDLLDRRPL